MSSEIDSDEEAVKRARAANTLFQSFSSEEEDNASTSRQREPSSRRNEKLLKLNSVRTKSKSKPRFLGDGLSDLEDDDILTRGIGGGGKEKERAHNRLFNEDDLANVSNKRSAINIPKRLDTSAIDRILAGGLDSDDENDITKLGTGTGEAGEEGEDGITIVKKKRIIAKMNDERLIGSNGFPALQKEIMKFKTKGKGNETQDLKRLMSIYQLWCHQMYPKTNLKDTLQTVEKLCHKRSVHRALKGYREESRNFGKPPPPPLIIPEDDDVDQEMGNLPSDSNNSNKDKVKEKSLSRSPSPPNPIQRPRFVVLPAASQSQSQASSSKLPSGTAKSDLDALFDDDEEDTDSFAQAGRDEQVPKEKEKEKVIIEEDDDEFGDDDDLFAMIDETTLVARIVKPATAVVNRKEEEEFDEDADEIMREMGMDF